MKGVTWNLWHGCHKYSEGCKNCYVFRSDSKYDRNPDLVVKTSKFNLPVSKNRKGEYKFPSDTMFWTCFSSDFLVEDADVWRNEAWKMIKERSDCHFLFITKRILRFMKCIPEDWGDGYDNVTVCVTCENQKRVDERLPCFKELPIKHKVFIHEPLLEAINIGSYLDETIEEVVVGGESGYYARDCNYEWIIDIREQCVKKNVTFTFKQTGSYFIKDNKRYKIERKFQHSQAHKANINFTSEKKSYIR